VMNGLLLRPISVTLERRKRNRLRRSRLAGVGVFQESVMEGEFAL
jgi:hypothetical protein